MDKVLGVTSRSGSSCDDAEDLDTTEDEEKMFLNLVGTDEFTSYARLGRNENESDHEIREDPLRLTSFVLDEDGQLKPKSVPRITRTNSTTRTTKLVETERSRRSCTENSSEKKKTPPIPENICEKCPRSFRTRRELQTHVAKNHPTVKNNSRKNSKTAQIPTDTLTCTSCSCKFSSKIGLDIHECVRSAVVVTTEPYPEILIKTEPEPEYEYSPSLSPQSPIWGNDNDSGTESVKGRSVRPLKKRKAESNYGTQSDDQESDAEARNRKRGQKSEETEEETTDPDFDPKPTRNGNKKFSKSKPKLRNAQKQKTRRSVHCKHCDETFVHPEDRESHMKTDHPGIECTILCDTCPLLFYHNSAYVVHKTVHSLPHPYACKYCDEKFISKRKLSVHKNSHSDSVTAASHDFCKTPKYKCPIPDCGAEFHIRDGLRDHKKTCHGDGNQRSKNDLTGTTSLLCKECGKLSTNKTALYIHEQRHLKRYPCDKCDKTFPSKGVLRRHYTLHFPDRPFKCDCGKSFRLEIHYNSHQQRVHIESAKIHQCQFCECRFADRSKLIIHERSHTGEKPFECLVPGCDARFAERSKLIIHERTHTGEKPFECLEPGCDARFSSSGARSTHRRYLHGTGKVIRKDYRQKGGPKIFPCPYCEKKFSAKGNVRSHVRTIHPGVGNKQLPFVCQHCGKGFTRQYAREVHERIHTGEKPFVCQLCSRPFGSKELLAVHMKTHLK